MQPDIYVKKYDAGCNGKPGINLILFRHQINLTMEEAQKLLTSLSSQMEGYGEVKKDQEE
jgi:hypothetical protein